jgi:beta-N-acetylhexosaminidase
LLAADLGFKGIVVTDALEMQGVARQWSPGEAAVKAIEAGADVLLMSPDPEAAVAAVVAAVESGRIGRERIERSVAKMLDAKDRLGLNLARLVDIEDLTESLDAPEDLQLAQEVADRAVTLVKNDKDVLPLRTRACFIVLQESRGSQAGRAFTTEVRRRAAGSPVAVLDPQVADAELASAADKTKACEAVVVAAFVSVAAYRGSVALAGGFPKLMQALLDAGKPVALVSLGNPYLVRSFPGVSAYLATYSTVPPSEVAAAKALFGEMPVRGRLPVTIPGVARYGDGIQLPAK